jgi:cyclic pyranopterin phosphate synthase
VECRKVSAFANDRLRISVTDACNLSCTYCSNEGQKHCRCGFLSVEWWKQFCKCVLNEKLYIRKLNITGGEPLLHRDLDSIISAGVEVAETISLNTNGVLLTSKRVEELYSLGLHNIKFGIDWMFGPESKPLRYPKMIDNERLLEVVKIAVSLMPRSSLNVVITEFNAKSISKVIDFVLENRINNVELLELIEHDFQKSGHSMIRPVTARGIVKSLGDRFSRIEYNPRLGKYLCWTSTEFLIQVAEDFCSRRVCRNLWSRIDTNGCLLPCIKGQDTYPIDLSSPLQPQVFSACSLMCNGPDGSVPRSTQGSILPKGEQGWYSKVDLSQLSAEGIGVSRLDP